MGKYDDYSIAAAWMDDPETQRLILEMREELQKEEKEKENGNEHNDD